MVRKGESDGDTEERVVKEGVGSACAAGRWGSEKVGGHKLIMAIDGSMDVSESVSLSLARSAACMPSKSPCRLIYIVGRVAAAATAAAHIDAAAVLRRLKFFLSLLLLCSASWLQTSAVVVPVANEEKKRVKNVSK